MIQFKEDNLILINLCNNQINLVQQIYKIYIMIIMKMIIQLVKK